jgi:catechol 2,3-dioxygenase
MQVQALGHVALKVRNLQRSEDFYSGTLGMPVISRLSDPRMTFFTLETTENHHDFALMELGSVAPAPAGDATGLAHVAFKVGSSLEEFELARRLLDESGTPVLYEAQRGFSRSVHVLDPDGNEVELYVDISGD